LEQVLQGPLDLGVLVAVHAGKIAQITGRVN
jgi:hypothetical protein